MNNFQNENRAMGYYPKDLNTNRTHPRDEFQNCQHEHSHENLLSSILGTKNFSNLFSSDTLNSLLTKQLLGENGQKNSMAMSMLNNLFSKSEKTSSVKESTFSDEYYEEL